MRTVFKEALIQRANLHVGHLNHVCLPLLLCLLAPFSFPQMSLSFTLGKQKLFPSVCGVYLHLMQQPNIDTQLHRV